jgi:hypothetical protein
MWLGARLVVPLRCCPAVSASGILASPSAEHAPGTPQPVFEGEGLIRIANPGLRSWRAILSAEQPGLLDHCGVLAGLGVELIVDGAALDLRQGGG